MIVDQLLKAGANPSATDMVCVKHFSVIDFEILKNECVDNDTGELE